MNTSEATNHLIIGLGGTGGKVIREFRKLCCRETDVKPDVLYEFLYVDTDPSLMGDDERWKVLGRSVRLDQTQQLLIDGANLSAVVANPAGYPQIEPWLRPVAPIRNLVNVNTAAGGQRRKFGRFLFANRAHEFLAKVNDRIKVLRRNRGSAVKVHIVCGLAGGTGSGSIVDVIAQIRKQYPDADQVRIIVYAVLPEAVPKDGWDTGNYHANGYAALKELNALAVGQYLPYDLTGSGGRRVERANIFFNGCYLVTNENVGGYTVDTEFELPGIIAEYLFVKTQVSGWESLDKAEKSENGTFDDEPSVADPSIKERSPRFLSFGIRRLVVPNEEIEEFLSYRFAGKAIAQAVFNNWVDGHGYADEPRPADYASEVRKVENLQRWLLSDDHLLLSIGILPDDAANTRWKRIPEFWAAVVSAQVNDIQSTRSDKAGWFSELRVRVERIYDEGYRALGGVKKFYEIKSKARGEMARLIRTTFERDLFADWVTGQKSTADIDRLLAALLELQEERLSQIDARIDSLSRATQQHLQAIAEVERRLGNISLLQKAVGRTADFFVEGATSIQAALVSRTTEEGWHFAKRLLEEVIREVIDLRGVIAQFQARLLSIGALFRAESDARLKQEPVDYKQKIFNADEVRSLDRQLLQSEDIQRQQAQACRLALVQRVGEARASFSAFQEKLASTEVRSLIESVAQAEVGKAHETIATSQRRVMRVNVVKKIEEEYEGDSDRLGRFVRETLIKAGVFAKFNSAQINLSGLGTIPERIGQISRTTGVLLPMCKEAGTFRDALAKSFDQNKPGGAFDILSDGVRSNELAVLSISNLFTLRCVEPMVMLHTKYDRRREASEEAATLMHTEGDGNSLPPLDIPTLSEVKGSKLHLLLLARAMGMILERPDRKTGKLTTFYAYEDDGLPAEEPIGAGSFVEAVEQIPLAVLNKIESSLGDRIKGALHAARLEWFESAKGVVRQVYEDRGRNAGDEVYLRYADVLKTEVKRLLELS